MRHILVIITFATMIAASLESKAQMSREELSQPLSKAIYIYPNPTNDQSDYINVRVAPLRSQSVKLILHNIIGNQINVETEVVDEHELRMKIKDLASGYYFVTVKDQESNFRGTYKLLKK